MIGIVVVTATLGNQKQIGEQLTERLAQTLSFQDKEIVLVTTETDCNAPFTKQFQKYSGLAIVVATGGTEANIQALCRSYHNPLLLLSTPDYNSLASGLEVFGKLRFTRHLRFHYSEKVGDFSEIERFYRIVKVLQRLQNTALASFGPPSKWVLTSENKKILGSFGFEYHELSFTTLQKALNTVKDAEIEESRKCLPSQFDVEKCPAEDLKKALQLYVALKQLITRHHFDVVTICCFDLLGSGFTACLALALLNSQGIVAGCEGDIQALISMVVAQYLTGKTPWMANPARISYKENSVTLAHCSVPFSLLDSVKDIDFLPHKESGLGISFQGKITAEKGVLLRIGGPELGNMLLTDVTVMQNNEKDPKLCNIQLKLKMNVPINEWVKHSLGNHQVFIPDVDSAIFRDFGFYQNLKVYP